MTNLTLVVGQKIRQLRRDHGLTQENLGLLIGVAQKTIAEWEIGNRLVRMDSLLKICDVFGLSLAFFDVKKNRRKKLVQRRSGTTVE